MNEYYDYLEQHWLRLTYYHNIYVTEPFIRNSILRLYYTIGPPFALK